MMGHRELAALRMARMHSDIVRDAMNGVCDWEHCVRPAQYVFPMANCHIPGLCHEACAEHAPRYLPLVAS